MSAGEMAVMKSAVGVLRSMMDLVIYDRGGPINAGGNDGFNVGVDA